MRLTDLQIKKIGSPEKGQKTYFDDAQPGFGLRVSQGGAKSFVVVYGKTRKLRTLGRYPDVSLADARKAAKKIIGDAAILQPDALLTSKIKFGEARDRFLRNSEDRTKPRTYEEYRRLLFRHFTFDCALSELTRVKIMGVVEDIEAPSERKHAYVAIRTMMNWCEQHGLINHSPVPRLKMVQTARSRILGDDELQIIWNRAEEAGYPYGTIVQLLILTGQRRGEIAALRRSWIEDDVLTFPEGFTKNKREHRIPLGALTRKIIKAIPDTGDLLFPGRLDKSLPFNGWSRCKRDFDRQINVRDYTLHDLRRTYSSTMAKLGVPIHVTERLLNHVSGTISGVGAVYNRHTYLPEMREAVASFESSLIADRSTGLLDNH